MNAPHATRGAGQTLVRAILDYLQERSLQAGERLPAERILAEKLGVGRNAVREALAILSTLRVVEIRPNSGVYLRRMSAESSFEEIVLGAGMGRAPTALELIESMEVRTALEMLAIRLACERHTAQDLAELNQVLEDEKAAVRRGENSARFDNAFHLRLVECAHNSILLRLLNSFYQLSLARREVFFASRARARESALEHRRIADALAARDVPGASALFQAHMQRARLYWASVLDTQTRPSTIRTG